MIRSQNNELIILEPFGTILIDQDDMMTAYHIYVHVSQGELLVGEYSTKEKAEKVLDMMVAHLEAEKNKNCCFKKGRTVFQMPRDQDVDTTKTLERTQKACQYTDCPYNTGGECAGVAILPIEKKRRGIAVPWKKQELTEQTQDVCGNVECAYNTGGKCPAAEGCGGYEEVDEKC